MVGGTLARERANPVVVIKTTIFKTASPDTKKWVDAATQV